MTVSRAARIRWASAGPLAQWLLLKGCSRSSQGLLKGCSRAAQGQGAVCAHGVLPQQGSCIRHMQRRVCCRTLYPFLHCTMSSNEAHKNEEPAALQGNIQTNAAALLLYVAASNSSIAHLFEVFVPELGHYGT